MNQLARPTALPRSRVLTQGGFALIGALMVLLMLTMLSVSMFHSLGLEERITGNTREKQHAFFAAQSALQSAEAWLNSGNAGSAITCPATTSTSAQICTVASTPTQQTFATTGWNCSFGTSYVPAAVTVSGNSVQQLIPGNNCSGSISSNASTANVYMEPQFAITYLGADPAGTGANLYQITSMGYGGNQNAVAVVQSVYSVGSGGAQQRSK